MVSTLPHSSEIHGSNPNVLHARVPNPNPPMSRNHTYYQHTSYRSPLEEALAHLWPKLGQVLKHIWACRRYIPCRTIIDSVNIPTLSTTLPKSIVHQKNPPTLCLSHSATSKKLINIYRFKMLVSIRIVWGQAFECLISTELLWMLLTEQTPFTVMSGMIYFETKWGNAFFHFFGFADQPLLRQLTLRMDNLVPTSW